MAADLPVKPDMSGRLMSSDSLKRALIVLAVLIVLPYAVAYYHSWEFSDFISQEARIATSASQLKMSVLNKAQSISLPITESDINITTTGAVFRLEVAYKVPVNLIIYRSHLNFEAAGSGLARR